MQRRSYFGVVWGSMQPYGPRFDPKGKRPQNSGVEAAAGALSSLSVDERCQEAVSPVSRRVAVGWYDFFLPQKTQLNNGISKHTQIEQLNHFFFVGLLYVGEEKRGRCEKDLVLNHQRYVYIYIYNH